MHLRKWLSSAENMV